MSEKQLLIEVNTRGKFSITESNSKFSEYKELADKRLIQLEEIKDTGVYVVSKNNKDSNS